jgi:hypothetical protein
MKLRIMIYLLVFSFSMSGCGDKVPPTPRKLQDISNTIELTHLGIFEKVLQVEVTDANNSKVLWKIESKNYTYLKQFAVKLGDIPDGFTQLYPIPPAIFTPTKGASYFVRFITSSNINRYISILFTAE